MFVTVDQLQDMVGEGRKIALAKDYKKDNITLIARDKVLRPQDIEKLAQLTRGKLEIKVASNIVVPTKLKSEMMVEITGLLKSHPYYEGLASGKRKEVERIILNIYPHNDYVSHALKHVHHFSKKLFSHSVHVGIISLIVDLGWQKRYNHGLIDSAKLEHIFFGALLHDIGYLTMDKALWEDSRRKDKDFSQRLLRDHPSRGYELLKRDESKHQFPPDILKIVLQHEEKEDNNGFPMGLSESQIDLNAKIVGLCNEFEHFISGESTDSQTPYKDFSRYFLDDKIRYDKDALSILLEEFRHLSIK